MMRYFFLVFILVSLTFTLAIKNQWISVTDKGHKDFAKFKIWVSHLWQQSQSLKDVGMSSHLKKGKEKINSTKSLIERKVDHEFQISEKVGEEFHEEIVEKTNESEDVLLKVLDKFYQIYQDLFGDPLLYRE